jgi:hypothetical protein
MVCWRPEGRKLKVSGEVHQQLQQKKGRRRERVNSAPLLNPFEISLFPVWIPQGYNIIQH